MRKASPFSLLLPEGGAAATPLRLCRLSGTPRELAVDLSSLPLPRFLVKVHNPRSFGVLLSRYSPRAVRWKVVGTDLLEVRYVEEDDLP